MNNTKQADFGWKKTESGYSARFFGKDALLYKDGKSWKINFGGAVTDLGRKASFDHAEAVILKS